MKCRLRDGLRIECSKWSPWDYYFVSESISKCRGMLVQSEEMSSQCLHIFPNSSQSLPHMFSCGRLHWRLGKLFIQMPKQLLGGAHRTSETILCLRDTAPTQCVRKDPWFQIFFIFTPTWRNDPIWRASIFFRWAVQPPTRLCQWASCGLRWSMQCYTTRRQKSSTLGLRLMVQICGIFMGKDVKKMMNENGNLLAKQLTSPQNGVG